MNRRIFLALLATYSLLGGTAHAEPPAKARELLNKAIAAHGGTQAMEKLLIASWKGRGLLYKEGKEDRPFPFYGDWSASLPSKYRYTHAFKAGGGQVPITTAIDGDKGWRSLRSNRGAEDLTAAGLKEEREEAHALYVSRLTPLFSADYQLTTLPVTKRDGRSIIGLKVDRPTYATIYLFFDQQKSLLTFLDRKVKEADGKEVLLESSFLNFRQMGGATLPQSITIHKGKKLVMELEIESVTPQTELSNKLFEKPPDPKDD